MGLERMGFVFHILEIKIKMFNLARRMPQEPTWDYKANKKASYRSCFLRSVRLLFATLQHLT